MPKTSRPTKRSRARSRPSTSGGLEDALRAISRATKRVKVGWYLFGAQAVALHGVPRATQDIDVTVLIGELSTRRLVDALTREGLVTRFDDDAFVAASRVIPAEHAASGWRVDVVLGSAGLEEDIARQAERRKIGRLTVPVLRAEHLVVLKLLAARPRDLIDVEGIIRVKGDELDLGMVRVLLQALGDALADSELASRFEAILGRSTP